MKRFGHLLLGALLLLAPRLSASTPDELFLQVYNLIEQGDTLQKNGQGMAAQAKYREALDQLQKLKKLYPYWKPAIIEYRQNYLQQRVGKAPAPEQALPADATRAPNRGGLTTPLPNPEIAALQEQIRRLQAERAKLEARLREALTARPAAVDPHEFEKVRARVAALQKENAQLKAKLAAASSAAPAAAKPESPEAKALEQAQKAAADLSRQLEAERAKVAALQKERDTLKQQLQKRPAAAPTPTTPAPQSAASAEELARAQATIKSLTQALEAEKKRAAELEHQLQAAREKLKKQRLSDAERQKIKDLETERDALRKQVMVLNRKLDELKLAKGDEAAKQLTERLNVLRARIQVYEAQAVPFTPEELALLRHQPTTEGLSDRSRLPATELPAGVAGLVSDAERAFRAERYAEAEAKYRQALASDEKNVHLLANLAACQLQQDKLAEAGKTLEKAARQDPMDPDVLSLKGLLEFRLKKYDDALKTLSQAAEANPESALTQNYLGVTLSQKGMRKQAERAFRKAIQIDPNYAEAHYNLAVLYARQEPAFPALARYHYEKAVAGGQPRNPELEKIIATAEKAAQ